MRDNQGDIDIISKPGAGADVRIRFAPDRLRNPAAAKTARTPKKPATKPKQQTAKTKQAAPKKQPAKTSRRKRA